MKMLQKRVLLVSMVTAFQLQGAGNNALTDAGKGWSRMITTTRLIKAGSGAGILAVGAHAVWKNMPLGDCFSEMPLSFKALFPLVAMYVVSDAVGDYARDKQLQELCAHVKSHATALGEHSNRLDRIDRVLGEHGTRLGSIESGLEKQIQKLNAMELTVTEWEKLRDERAQRLLPHASSTRPPSAAVFDEIADQVIEKALKQFSSRPGSQRGVGSGAFHSLGAAHANGDESDATT